MASPFGFFISEAMGRAPRKVAGFLLDNSPSRSTPNFPRKKKRKKMVLSLLSPTRNILSTRDEEKNYNGSKPLLSLPFTFFTTFTLLRKSNSSHHLFLYPHPPSTSYSAPPTDTPLVTSFTCSGREFSYSSADIFKTHFENQLNLIGL